MNRLFRWARRFIRELRRRRVIRVAVVYAGTAFVILQLGEILVEPFGLPPWTLRMVTFLLVLGFPLAVGLAWVFDVTEEGLVRTGTEEDASELFGSEGKPFTSNAVLIGLLIVAIGLLLYPRVFPSEEPTSTGRPTAAGTTQVTDRSIAVLPFEPLSSGEKSKTFARGIHDDLITRLANISALKVISRTAVQQYRNTDLTTGEIADSLGVRWVMEGGVEVLGSQIQVNAQLIDPRTETHAWAEDYRRKLTAEDLFAIQTEITGEIASALQANLTAGEQKRIAGAPTGDLKAYRLYVEGRTLLDRRTEAGMRQAMGYFRRAIEEDSSYALAWAGLADARSLLASYGYGPVDSLRAQALGAAHRALELEPQLAEAHASLGLIYQDLRRDGPTALRELRRAVELKPSYARAHHWLGILEMALGRLDAGLASLRRAAELAPNSPPIHVALSWGHLLDGRAQKALQSARRSQELSPGYPLARMVEGAMLIETGKLEAGLKALRRGLDAARPESATRKMLLGWPAVAHVHGGDTAKAKAYLAELERQGANRFAQGLAHAVLGQTDAAFADLEKARWTYVNSSMLRYGRAFEPLRDLPRYEALIRKVNRTWGLRPDGTIPKETSPSRTET